jgi:hypothetical protein
MALLCEDAQVEETGRPTLIGAFSRVGAVALPVAMPPRVLALEFWGRPYSSVSFSLRFAGASFEKPITSPEQEVEIERHGFVAFGAQIGGLQLAAEGEHRIDVLDAEGERMGGVRFVVAVLPEESDEDGLDD